MIDTTPLRRHARPAFRPACLAALTLVAGLLAAPAHAGSVRLDINIGVCNRTVDVHHDAGDGQVADSHRLEAGECRAEATAITGPGLVQLNSRVGIDSGTWASGSVAARSSGFSIEQVRVTAMNSFDEVVSPSGLRTVLIQPRVRVSGSASADRPTPDDLGSASAVFDFSVTFPGSGGPRSGLVSVTNGATTAAGELGVLTGSAVLVELGSEHVVSLEASTYASIGKQFQPSLDVFHAHAQADFMHTLQWLGIDVLDAFDADGNRVTLPSGLRIAFTGVTSGFDYAFAARPAFRIADDGSIVDARNDPVAVPLPATGSLLAAALAALALSRRRGGARQASR